VSAAYARRYLPADTALMGSTALRLGLATVCAIAMATVRDVPVLVAAPKASR
jgi:hypothetical protein